MNATGSPHSTRSPSFKTQRRRGALLAGPLQPDLHLLSNRLIRTAVAFFVVGVALGTGMGATQDFRLMHVHAHVNLLGWVALGLIGLLYAAHPRLSQGFRAHAHYWLHTLGLVLFMGAYAVGVLGGAKPVPAIAAGASLVSLGVLLFAVNFFTRLR